MGPGWLGVIAVVAAVTMTYGNFAALAQRNFKRMLAYSSIAHAGYMLVGVAAASVSTRGAEAAGAVLYYLVVYAFTNVGAFAVAAWLVRDKKTDDIDDLNGLGFQSPLLAVCIVILMLSLIGIPPFAGFFGKLYMFMEALNQDGGQARLTLIGLVALGLFNSVVSAFYYVRVLKAMFLREPSGKLRLGAAERSIEIPIVIGALVAIVFGLFPGSADVGHAGGLRADADRDGGRLRVDGLGAERNGLRDAQGRPPSRVPGRDPEAITKASQMTPEQRKRTRKCSRRAPDRPACSPAEPGRPAPRRLPSRRRKAEPEARPRRAPAKKAEAEPKKTP